MHFSIFFQCSQVAFNKILSLFSAKVLHNFSFESIEYHHYFSTLSYHLVSFLVDENETTRVGDGGNRRVIKTFQRFSIRGTSCMFDLHVWLLLFADWQISYSTSWCRRCTISSRTFTHRYSSTDRYGWNSESCHSGRTFTIIFQLILLEA